MDLFSETAEHVRIKYRISIVPDRKCDTNDPETKICKGTVRDVVCGAETLAFPLILTVKKRSNFLPGLPTIVMVSSLACYPNK